jgi:hypothetical protein
MGQRARWYQEYLRDEEIINDLYSDNLLDVPDDIFSEVILQVGVTKRESMC